MKAQTNIDLALLRRRLAPLQQGWERQARRIDALSVRERAILFLSVAAVLAALFDSLVLTPQSSYARQREAQRLQQSAELTQLREQFIAASRNTDNPAVPLRAQLDATLTERASLDDALRRVSAINSGEGLSAVLQRLLAQQPGLMLERLTLMDDSPVIAPASTSSSPSTQRPGMTGMRWQGVELQVQGSYRDIQRHLQALERELPGLRWGDMRLTSPSPGERPRLVTQVFLLKVQP